MGRKTELFFAIIIFLFFTPLFLSIILLIKATSIGPIIFKQKRIGIYGNKFNIYKFRTMKFDTPSNIPTHKLEDPKRYITKVGKFLRKSSLDELPQLINIIKGGMSFVGPRPALYNQHDLNNLRIKNRIDGVKPGITGWAQINGRDELDLENKVKYDKYYIKNKSFYFDCKIIFITFFKILISKGVLEGKKSIKKEKELC